MLDRDLVLLDPDLLRPDLPEACPSAIIGTAARLAVLGGRTDHRSEDLA